MHFRMMCFVLAAAMCVASYNAVRASEPEKEWSLQGKWVLKAILEVDKPEEVHVVTDEGYLTLEYFAWTARRTFKGVESSPFRYRLLEYPGVPRLKVLKCKRSHDETWDTHVVVAAADTLGMVIPDGEDSTKVCCFIFERKIDNTEENNFEDPFAPGS